jgi:hypothetical protein
MSKDSKSGEEIQREVLAAKQRIEARLAEYKARRKKPLDALLVNHPNIRRGIQWFCIVGGIVIFGWTLHKSQHPWRALFMGDLPNKLINVLVYQLGMGFILAMIVYAVIDHLKQKQKLKAEADWNRKLEDTVDVRDFKDGECLYHWLEPDERQRLLRELQRMPKGSRSLFKAVQMVSPELVEE